MVKVKDPRQWPDATKRRIAGFIDKQTITTSQTVNTPCWLWTGWKDKFGYGRFSIPHPDGNGKHRVNLQAHRVVYGIANGTIPDGMVLDHLCYNRSCVRPSHLEIVTQEENVRRRDEQASRSLQREARG